MSTRGFIPRGIAEVRQTYCQIKTYMQCSLSAGQRRTGHAGAGKAVPKSKTGLFGVSEQKVGAVMKYVASLKHKGQNIYCGMHDTKEAAARAYDKKAYELKGANANLNFPEEIFTGIAQGE